MLFDEITGKEPDHLPVIVDYHIYFEMKSRQPRGLLQVQPELVVVQMVVVRATLSVLVVMLNGVYAANPGEDYFAAPAEPG